MRTTATLVTAVLVAAMAGCVGTADIGPSGRDGDAAIEFLSPEVGDSAVRDQLTDLGARVAPLEVRLQVSGLAGVELWVGARRLAAAEVVGTMLELDADIDVSGAITLEARGLDEGGEILISSSIDLDIGDPDFSCLEFLDFYGLAYSEGPAEPGIDDPVTVSMPISGIAYRSGGGPRDSMLGDCGLVHALAETAPLLHRRDIVEVTDLGVYNYRCIGGGAPPDCPNGVSQHAYANAIDIAGYTTSEDTFYSVNDDWLIDPDSEDTCSAATDGDKDTFLHDTICEQKAAGVWNIVLTPNYNADHRNHFHVDLTDGSDFIE